MDRVLEIPLSLMSDFLKDYIYIRNKRDNNNKYM